ncbi:uncharacterized protein METZ01_LOCUS151020, partial [marine metagenome]
SGCALPIISGMLLMEDTLIKSVVLLGFIWLALPAENKKMADIQLLLLFIFFFLLFLLGIYFTVALYKGWIVLNL